MTDVEEIVRKAKIGRRLLVFVVAATCLGTLYAIAVNVGQGDDITNIQKTQKTQCTLHPAGKACTKIKERIAFTGSLKNMCIEHQRVTGTKGRNCPQFYISAPHTHTAAIDRTSTAAPAITARGDGEAPPSQAGGDAPDAPAPTHPEHHHPDQPRSPSPPEPPTGSSAGGEETTAAAPAGAEPEPAPAPTPDAAAAPTKSGILDDPGGLLGEVVCVTNRLGLPICTE
jgi:hypothetical protein